MIRKKKKAHRWIAGSMASLAMVLLFSACGLSVKDGEHVFSLNRQDGTMTGTPDVITSHSEKPSPAVSPAASDEGNTNSGENPATAPQLSVDAAMPSEETAGIANQTAAAEAGKPEKTPTQTPSSDISPEFSATAEAPQEEAEIIVRSGNILSSTEKEALLKELESELDSLFGAIAEVNAEPQPDLPE